MHQTLGKIELEVVWNATKPIWRPASARTHWGAYTALPALLLGLGGEIGEGSENKRKKRNRKGTVQCLRSLFWIFGCATV